LASAGYQVVATARQIESLAGLDVAMALQVDVTDSASIHASVEAVLQQYGRVDLLVNNAGFALRGAVEEVDVRAVERMFDTNVLGIMRMVQAVVPVMRRQHSGRIVNVGSLVGKLSGPSNGTYAATKHAVEALTDALRWELEPFGVHVVLVQPGAVASAFEQTVVRESSPLLARSDSPYAPLYARVENVSADMRRTEAAAEVVASVILTAVQAEHPHARYPAAVPFLAQIAMQLPDPAKDLFVRRLYGLHTLSEVAARSEIADGVWRLSVHGANLYFLRSQEGWALVDAAWSWGDCAHVIRSASAALLGPNASPTAIVLTHLHPDHDGAALELAEAWKCPVYVHGDELPLAQAVAAQDLAGIAHYGNGLDRGVIVPIMRVLPRRRPDPTLASPSLANVARRLEPSGVPGLPDWTWVPTPGHAPGHVALFRQIDRVLLSGDAVLTVDASSVGGYLAWAIGRRPPHAFPPPAYTNWNQSATDASLLVLAALEPRVLATGHGAPLVGDAATHELQAVALRARSHSLGGHNASPPLTRNLYNRTNGDDDRRNSECECDREKG
jgi:NADP-dependent 3-hydroxy acid dehydrogenase YdfG/glyoxylase-like metal-dependent hydrolase (beta-lactamase superfamily II)